MYMQGWLIPYHAKCINWAQLTFITQATEADAVLAIALYEESLASLLGMSNSPLSQHF